MVIDRSSAAEATPHAGIRELIAYFLRLGLMGFAAVSSPAMLCEHSYHLDYGAKAATYATLTWEKSAAPPQSSRHRV